MDNDPRMTDGINVEKIAPSTIVRPRVMEWLGRNAAFPLRALIAPAGYGKTAAIVHYLGALGEKHAYVRAAPGDSPAHLSARVAAALDIPSVGCFEELRVRLVGSAACTIAIDALDLASDKAIVEVGTFAMGCPEQIRTIVSGCRMETVHTPRLFTQGLAALMSAARLAFTVDDLAALCSKLKVDFNEADLRALALFSDGWPLVASAVVRAAASDGRPLHGAYEIWLAGSAHTLRQFAEAEVNRAPSRARSAFARAIHGEFLLEDEWQMLEAAGLFVRADDDGYRLLHPVGAIHAQGPRFGHVASPRRLALALFGEFEASYGGTLVKWLRRRDMEIVRMLAMRVGGTADRTELMTYFWPGSPRRAAQQSLRTSCSNVRKAIAALVGANRIDRYFICGAETITLDPNAVSLDAHRFLSHVSAGDEAFKDGQEERAAAHYRAALRLHRGAPSIDSLDGVQTAFSARLEEAYAHAQRRVGEMDATPEDVRKLGSTGRAGATGTSRAAS
jgi:hypothetical protein